LSLGEASLSANHVNDGWNLEMTLDARIPGFAIADRFHSVSDPDQCSQEFERNISQGHKKTSEKTTFVSKKDTARRVTVSGGGSTEFAIPGCARDALAFVYYARRQLAQGKLAPSQDIYFGSAYSVRLEYTGAQTVTVAGKASVSDRVMVYLKGPASNTNFEIFFARDAARTPVLTRVPLTLGTLSMELMP